MRKKRLPIGISDFKEIVQQNYAYVDKTLLIQELLDLGSKAFLLPRPRRFGKTLNLSMLRYFFEKSKEDHATLFHRYKIWQTDYRELQGKYPVVFLSFKEIKCTTWKESLEVFSLLIAREFRRHEELLDNMQLSDIEKEEYRSVMQKKSSLATLRSSLYMLIDILARYHKQNVYVLIDEYDTPVHAAYLHNYYDDMMEFMRGFLGDGLKDNSCLERAVLTGVFRVAKESIFSGLNHFACHTLLGKRFCDKFGLIEEEVFALLQEQGLSCAMEEMSVWYNGYQIGEYAIYNPWSILQCIEHHGTLQPYWINTSDNALIRKMLLCGSAMLKKDLEEVLQGKAIIKPLKEEMIFGSLSREESAVWSLLLFSGYLTLKEHIYCENHVLLYSLQVPNQEILSFYRTIITDWFCDVLSSAECSQLLFNSLVQGDVDTFVSLFQEFIMMSMSYYDISGQEPERVYHAFILGFFVFLKNTHYVQSNRESGFGRYDVCVIPKDQTKLGIVMEFKKAAKKESLETAAKKALLQIKERNYVQELYSRGIRNVLYLGLAFRGKQISMCQEKLHIP